ncbi:AAA family ATPase [Ekhidna sp.]|uniref:AAA family ATPase n=1 Tax=Ekhidna sp. TaxID=2608089 RepID=UPI003BA9A1E3
MVKRIAIIGPESTGKSELCQHLAMHYNTEWVPEYARFYLDRLDGGYQQHDLKSIAEGQLSWEDEKAEYANKYLICDTNLIVVKIWSDHKYGNTDKWIEEQLHKRTYDFYLLSNIDIPWMPDSQREHPKLRKHFFEVYKNYLEAKKLPYAIISGIEGERKKCAVDAIESNFENREDVGSNKA